MKTIIEEKEIIFIKEKSKFIGIIKKVYDLKEIKDILDKTKREYFDSTHICYAYILPNNKKCFDDNEPSKTAGKPILDILEKNDLCFVLAIVVRYFGGIKLGSNGLIRAYSGTISSIITNNTKKIEKGYLIKIIEDYSKNDLLLYLLKNSDIIKKEYQDKILIEAIVKEDTLENLLNINYQIIEEKII